MSSSQYARRGARSGVGGSVTSSEGGSADAGVVVHNGDVDASAQWHDCFNTSVFTSTTHIPPYGVQFRLPTESRHKTPTRCALYHGWSYTNFSRCDLYIGFRWSGPLGQKSSKWEKTCSTPIPLTVPNFIGVREKHYQSLLHQTNLYISTILPLWWDKNA